MSKLAAKVIADGFKELKIEYGFGIYAKNPVIYPYFVGDYTESESFSEDGLVESTWSLTGFSRDTWETLETAREKIEKYFDRIDGKIVRADDGSIIVCSYAGSLIVPTGDPELKKIQINLNVKEWRTN